MFKIEELLDLFRHDTEVMKAILSAYEVSQKGNKELSDKVFKQLFFLKLVQTDLQIEVNPRETEEIIADYQAINLIDLNNKYFLLLKQILGENFVAFLDSRCR